jgi:hypothetical protein
MMSVKERRRRSQRLLLQRKGAVKASMVSTRFRPDFLVSVRSDKVLCTS